MKPKGYRVKIGIVGCGAIGSRIAKSVCTHLKKDCRISGVYDIDYAKAEALRKSLRLKKKADTSLENLIKNCDCMVEAVNAQNTSDIIRQAIRAHKSVLVMSVGKILKAPDLFPLARKNKCYLLLPSGAIAGVDAIKAASNVGVKRIILTTRKPPIGLVCNPYLIKNKIDLSKVKKETVIFEGDVATAVKLFPQNINVAATIALASQLEKKILIRIITSPQFKTNSHEIIMEGDFGRILTRTDNVVCPDNPKTSYLAVLSGIQTLKQYCTGILIGS